MIILPASDLFATVSHGYLFDFDKNTEWLFKKTLINKYLSRRIAGRNEISLRLHCALSVLEQDGGTGFHHLPIWPILAYMLSLPPIRRLSIYACTKKDRTLKHNPKVQ